MSMQVSICIMCRWIPAFLSSRSIYSTSQRSGMNRSLSTSSSHPLITHQKLYCEHFTSFYLFVISMRCSMSVVLHQPKAKHAVAGFVSPCTNDRFIQVGTGTENRLSRCTKPAVGSHPKAERGQDGGNNYGHVRNTFRTCLAP